jgi:hypothetical protein
MGNKFGIDPAGLTGILSAYSPSNQTGIKAGCWRPWSTDQPEENHFDSKSIILKTRKKLHE